MAGTSNPVTRETFRTVSQTKMQAAMIIPVPRKKASPLTKRYVTVFVGRHSFLFILSTNFAMDITKRDATITRRVQLDG